MLSISLALNLPLFTIPNPMNVTAATTLLYPLPENSFVLTQKYSASHKAVDWGTLGSKTGVPIYAVEDGVVRTAASCGTYGILIVLWHESIGRYSAYAHCENTNYVSVGQKVKRGDTIATVGMTGNTSGPHLHFMIFKQMQSSSSNYPREATCEDPLSYSYTYAKNYAVSLNANGGEVSPTSITVSGTYSGLPTPSRNGYAFAGWYTDPSGGTNVWNGAGLAVNGNHTLYAHWKKWYADLTPANLGSSFDAIILNKNCWKPIRPNSSSNVFLYKEEWITGEMWRFTRQSDGSYKIVNFSNGQCLDANGAGTTDGTNVGTYNSNDSNAQRWFIYEMNGGYVLRAACGDLVMDLDGNKSADNTNIHLWTYHGGEAQVFSLYHTRGDSVVSDYAKPSPSAPTLTVKSYSSIALSWNVTAYTEKYNVYRSTDNSTWKKMGEATSTSYTDTGLTAKTKYYYKIEAVNRFYTVSSPSASATTSEIPRYTVVFNSNSGSGSMSNQIINRDEATALNANQFRKEGYSFFGWSTDKIATKATYTDKQSVTDLAAGGGTVTLYAIWKANTYKVTLDDGSGKTTVIDVTYDGKYNVHDATKDGYHFAGWYTKSNGEGTMISKDTTVKITAAQTLYACWKKDVLAITFNTNGGEAELTEKLVSYDTKYGYLPDATKQGYEFGGWYLDKALTQQITADSIVKITVSQEVYAKWAQVIPIITFDAKGGTAEMDTKQVVMGKTYGVLPDAEKEGCEFIGWFTESGMEIVSDSIVEIAEDTTVYAKWRMKGDADADGDVDIDDVIMLQQWLLAVPDDPLTDWKAVDLCQDERIDVFDLCLLKRLLIERNGD